MFLLSIVRYPPPPNTTHTPLSFRSRRKEEGVWHREGILFLTFVRVGHLCYREPTALPHRATGEGVTSGKPNSSTVYLIEEPKKVFNKKGTKREKCRSPHSLLVHQLAKIPSIKRE